MNRNQKVNPPMNANRKRILQDDGQQDNFQQPDSHHLVKTFQGLEDFCPIFPTLPPSLKLRRDRWKQAEPAPILFSKGWKITQRGSGIG